MEFPNLGNHCNEQSCNRLDFLPMKCDACSNVFCNDHFHYSQHSCNGAYQKDVQVPVCPLCNNPVPSKKGEQPDIAVGMHIDRDCQADPALSKRKIYTNKCSVKGCKQKEVIKLTCDVCRKDYCLKHRHASDHKCYEHSVTVTPSQAAGSAAIARAQNARKQKSFSWKSMSNFSFSMDRSRAPASRMDITSCQAGLSEDEALALALQKSVNETKPKNIQEEEDRSLALALANSEQDQNISSQRPQNGEKNCTVS